MASSANFSFDRILELISQLSASTIINAIYSSSSEVFTAMTEVLASHSSNVSQHTVKELFVTAMTLCQDNPVQAAALVLVFAAFIAPAALWGPFASVLGFTSSGPAAGSVAAFFQAKYGTIAGFSILQSAVMAGYGIPIMNGITQAGGIVGAVYLYNTSASWFSSDR